MSTTRKSYPSDVSDAEWEFLLPYLTLMREDAPQREYSLRDVFDAMRYVMSRIPFDRDAITLTPPHARGLLANGGFTILRTDFLFIFPRVLAWFRAIEPLFAGLPFGAQYLVLARKMAG